MNLAELRRQRAAKIAALRQLLDGAETQNRGLSDQESADYDQLNSDIESLDDQISQRERLEQLESSVSDSPARPEPQDSPNIGMSERDIQEYSLVRAIRATADGNWAGAELEREASEAVAQRTGTTPQGFFVPNDWVTRDLTVGTPTAGGHTVDDELLASSFIELLRNRLVLTQAGVRMLNGLEGNVSIPRQTGGATAYWVGEGANVTESQQTVDQVGLTPHTVGAFTDFSRRLILQSSIGVEQFVRDDLARVLALAIDFAGLHGNSGVDANQPDGLEQLAGIGAVVGGANGAAPTWGHIVDLETEVSADNADAGSLGYVTNSKVRGALKQTEKFAGSNGVTVWADGSSPLNGQRAITSNQVRGDIAKGSGTNLSAIFYGNWADMIMGLWSGLDIMVDPYTHSTSGTMRVVALQDVDFAFRHAASFAAMLDALTA